MNRVTAGLAASCVAFASLFLVGSMLAGDAPPEYRDADPKLGGLLYDNWPKILGTNLLDTHPLYPDTGRQSGASTWRCKECHGWDYIGKEGRYKSGSHFTGFSGVLPARTFAPDTLYGILGGDVPGHDFSRWLSPGQRWALAKFLREGVVDWATVLGGDGSVAGDPAGGKRLYGTHCARCHSEDGTKHDFKGNKAGVQGVGWLARENPQETLHKIRWGHPGTDMPSAVVDGGLTDVQTIDLLAYCSGLP